MTYLTQAEREAVAEIVGKLSGEYGATPNILMVHAFAALCATVAIDAPCDPLDVLTEFRGSMLYYFDLFNAELTRRNAANGIKPQ